MTHPQFSLARDDATSTVTVCGDIKQTDLDDLRTMIERSGGRRTTVDLSGVTYLPSYAVGALATLLRDHGAGDVPDVEIVVRYGTIAASVLAVVAIPHRVVVGDDGRFGS